jgi:type II secretory pathway pseudopilin PulG
MRPRSRNNTVGITLLETLLAATVLAMAAAVVVLPFAAGARCTAEDAKLTLAVNLAEGLMEEILARSFVDPDDDELGEITRQSWDDMDDYDGHIETAGQVVGFDGVRVDDPAAMGLSRSAAVQGVYVTGQDTRRPPSFLRVSVEVCHHGSPLVTLSRLVYSNE